MQLDVNGLYAFYDTPANRALLSENALYQALFFQEHGEQDFPRHDAHLKVLVSLRLMSPSLKRNQGAADAFRLEYNKHFNVTIDKQQYDGLADRILQSGLIDKYGLYERKSRLGKWIESLINLYYTNFLSFPLFLLRYAIMIPIKRVCAIKKYNKYFNIDHTALLKWLSVTTWDASVCAFYINVIHRVL